MGQVVWCAGQDGYNEYHDHFPGVRRRDLVRQGSGARALLAADLPQTVEAAAALAHGEVVMLGLPQNGLTEGFL